MSNEIKEIFGKDISGIIFGYLSGENHDDIYKAEEYIKTDSRLFLFEKENIDWSESDIEDVYEKGWIDIVKHKNFKSTKPKTLIKALKSGNTEMIEYALENVIPDGECLISCISYKPEMFQKIWEKSDKSDKKRKACVNQFMKLGHIDFFKQFYKTPLDIDFKSIKIACIEHRDNIVDLITNDDEILKHIDDSCWNLLAYLIENSYYDITTSLLKTHPSLLTIKCINEACISGNEKILRLCLEIEPNYIDYAYFGPDISCSKGYFDVIKTLAEYGYIFSEDSINGSVESGHLDITIFLYKIYMLEPAGFAIEEATTKGHLEVLKWLYNTKLIKVIDLNDLLITACCSNKLSIVKWLCEIIGLEPTQSCMDCACERNCIDIAKFLHEIYGMMCIDTSFDVTASEGYIDMIIWLTSIKNGATVDAIDSCASTNEFEILKWLNENRKEKGTERAIENAVKIGNVEMVKYLLKNDYPVCSSKYLMNAMNDYRNKNSKIDCLLIILSKHPELFTGEMLTLSTSYATLEKMLKFCDQDELSPTILYSVVIKGVTSSRLKIIKKFINRIADVIEPEDKLELLNSAESEYIKSYLKMRLITLPEKIDYLFDIIDHINREIHNNLSELNDHWGNLIDNGKDVIENTRDVFEKIIEHVNEENINKYGAICYLIALQYRTKNSICSKPIKFSIEVTKLIEQLEIKPKENFIETFDANEYGLMLKTVLKIVSLTPTMEIN